jgi:hypothetical protein
MEKRVDSGRAYGFFQCDASKEEIEATLPKIRDAVGTPSTLELSLIDDIGNLEGDKRIITLAQEAREAGLNYILQATNPEGTNLETADELALILNQAYQSPLYEAGAPFNGEIVYEMNGEYIFRE